jgi:hypothetical protein
MSRHFPPAAVPNMTSISQGATPALSQTPYFNLEQGGFQASYIDQIRNVRCQRKKNKRHYQLFNFLFVSWLCIPAQLELCLGTIHLCCCFILPGHSCAIQLFRLIAPFLPMLQSAAPEYLDGQSSKRRSFGERLCYGAGVSYLVGASDNTFFDTLYACSGPLFWFW